MCEPDSPIRAEFVLLRNRPCQFRLHRGALAAGEITAPQLVGRSDREEIGKALAVRRRGNPETWRRAGYLVLRTSQALMKLPLRLSVQLQRGLGPNAILL
jgi:hypothetical protein